MNKVVWYECKYCDSTSGPALYEGDQVCRNCGAEWNPVLCEQDSQEFEREMRELDEELERFEEDEPYYPDEEVIEEDICMSYQPCDGKCEHCLAYDV